VSAPAVTITIPADTAEWLRGVVDNARVWAERRRHDLGGDQRTQSAAWAAGREATHALMVLAQLPAPPAKEDAA
jgi:hypothetical protein